MDKTTTQGIKDNALLIAEYAAIPDQLRAIANFQAEPKFKKQLQEIASLLENKIPALMHSPLLRSLQTYRLMSAGDFAGDEEIAAKLGCSRQTAQQTINALKGGGIEIQTATAKGFKVSPKGGRKRAGRALG